MRASITSTPALARRSWISLLQLLGDLVGVPRSEISPVVVRVVGVARGEVAQRGLALHAGRSARSRPPRTWPRPCRPRCHTTTAAISIGLPSVSLTLSCALSKLRTRSEIRFLRVERVRPAQARRRARCRGRRRRAGARAPSFGATVKRPSEARASSGRERAPRPPPRRRRRPGRADEAQARDHHQDQKHEDISSPEAVWRSRSRIISLLLLVLTSPDAGAHKAPRAVQIDFHWPIPELRPRLGRREEARQAAVAAHDEREPRRPQETSEPRQIVGRLPAPGARLRPAVQRVPTTVRARPTTSIALASSNINMISLCDLLSRGRSGAPRGAWGDEVPPEQGRRNRPRLSTPSIPRSWRATRRSGAPRGGATTRALKGHDLWD